MAFDREASLRKAEKLLRQGRLDGAIEEYVRILQEQPKDWNTRNVLGDLFVRANMLDQAANQFTEIADHFAREGFFPKAIALYKKVVKIKADDEHALMQTADISARQGLLVEAKACYAAVAEQRRQRGDKKGANEIVLKLAALDPADVGVRTAAARAAAELGDAAGAADRYKQLASDLFERDRPQEAIDALALAVQYDGSDTSARDSLVAAYLNMGAIDQARQYASTAGHFRVLSDALSASQRADEAIEALAEASRLDPSDVDTRARLARTFMGRGEWERAAGCFDPATIGGQPDLLLLAAEVDLRAGRTDAARDLMRSLLETAADRRADVVRLACAVAQTDADAGFACVEVAADAAVAAHDLAGAAAALQEFAQVAPSHVPTLIRLVDVCVDGDLDEPLLASQARLADCYLAAGRAFEARVIAEDLVTRAPGDTTNVDRFRRALVMLGVADPDTVIADRLNADSSIVVEDLNLEMPPESVEPEPVTVNAGTAFGARTPTPAVEPVAEEPPAPTVEPATTRGKAHPPEAEKTAEPEKKAGADRHAGGAEPKGKHRGEGAGEPARAASAKKEPAAIDVHDDQMGADDVHLTPKGGQTDEHDAGEGDAFEIDIDLSGALGDMMAGPAAMKDGHLAENARRARGDQTLDDAFNEFRQEMGREQESSSAAQHYKLALTYHDMGMTDECVKALEVAARSPRYRFQSASLLGRLHRAAGRTQAAIEWFERAAEAPASNVEAGRALLYELGRTLEDAGESVRALAVYLELQADADDYRDVSARIKKLS